MNRHIKICVGKLNKSGGEFAVMKVLELMSLEYEMEYTYADCKSIRTLPFDFYIPTHNMLIEFDGRQHFRPVQFGGMSKEKAEAAFERQQKHDAIKNDYCSDNNIPLLRIKYSDIDAVPELVQAFIDELTA